MHFPVPVTWSSCPRFIIIRALYYSICYTIGNLELIYNSDLKFSIFGIKSLYTIFSNGRHAMMRNTNYFISSL